MPLDFDFKNVETVEFGVGKYLDGLQNYVLVPVDEAVQNVLVEMAAETWCQLADLEDEVEPYDVSEKHGSIEYRTMALDNLLVADLKALHEALNMYTDANALNDSAAVSCYLCRFVDNQGRKLTAVRRATQFKGVLKCRLIQLLTDTMYMVEDKIFKLDSDFDFLIDDVKIHILRPTGFEFVGGLSQLILKAVPRNIVRIRENLPYVNFDGVELYAATHPRAARYLASICSTDQSVGVTKAALVKLCKQTGVAVTLSNNSIYIAEGYEMGFLEVLDRRRYSLELVAGSPEKYRAPSRTKL